MHGARLALLKPFGRDLRQIVGYGLLLVFLLRGRNVRRAATRRGISA